MVVVRLRKPMGVDSEHMPLNGLCRVAGQIKVHMVGGVGYRVSVTVYPVGQPQGVFFRQRISDLQGEVAGEASISGEKREKVMLFSAVSFTCHR